MGGAHRVKGGTGKAEDATLPDAGISPKQSYIRECQEKHLSLGSVPRYFSLGIQPNWLGVHPRSASGPVRFVAGSGETLLLPCGSISRL
jgi:hypothetical protein